MSTGCGCKEVYRFPHYLSLLLLYLFFYVHFLKCFSFFTYIECLEGVHVYIM